MTTTPDADARAAAVADPNLEHLLGRVALVEERIRWLVAARRREDPNPDDPFRGLYLSDEAVDRLLAGPGAVPDGPDVAHRLAAVERRADDAVAAGARLRLREVTDGFDLSPADVELLLVAVVGDLDPRFEQLFGYLNDDVTRRRPGVAVALALCGEPLAGAAARARLLHGPLVAGGLVVVEDGDRPFPGRALRVPDRVVGHLLGDDTTDGALTGVVVDPPPVRWGTSSELDRALAHGAPLLYLREDGTGAGSGAVLAVAASERAGTGAVQADLSAVAAAPDPVGVARSVAREARLRGRAVVAGPVEALGERTGPVLAALRPGRRSLLLVGSAAWDPVWTPSPPVVVAVPAITPDERTTLWEHTLAAGAPTAAGLDVRATTEQFRLRPEQVVRAATNAVVQAGAALDGTITEEHLRAAARAENGSALDGLARRVEPAVGWDDLVLPATVRSALREVALRARHRERVLGRWRMRPGGGRGQGVAALFAGDSGTGKTMSAEVVAADLGVDLYVVDLSTVVDKYVGETEKNLERIFTAAAGINGVLLFDEADAVFGKRSEVSDAHDRYANIESAYLLQRMESFDGVVVLATNLRANLDDAFTRRLDVLVDFPLPDGEHRRALWDRCLGPLLPRADDLDLDFVAEAFDLAGGAIRSSAVTAAYLAAADDGPVTMRHLVRAVEGEYRKLGRLCLESEFGPYWPLLMNAKTR